MKAKDDELLPQFYSIAALVLKKHNLHCSSCNAGNHDL